LTNRQSIVDEHGAKEITWFFFILEMTIAAMLMHLRKTNAKEETLISKDLSFVTIGTFVSENMV
jgi:hypothetical protein